LLPPQKEEYRTMKRKQTFLIVLVGILMFASGCSDYPRSNQEPQPESSEDQIEGDSTPNFGYDILTTIDSDADEPAGISAYSITAVTGLTRDTSIGLAAFLDYADEDIVIFHVEFGLFIYDLKLETITFSVDLEKTVGTTRLQGNEEPGVRIIVSSDGSLIQLSGGIHAPYFVINTSDGTYSIEEYWSVFSTYDKLQGVLGGELFSTDPAGGVGTVEQLCFRRGEASWFLFSKWDY